MQNKIIRILKLYSNFNFFMSPMFLEIMIKRDKLTIEGDTIRYDDDICFFPPPYRSDDQIYMDYEGYRGIGKRELCDYEYIYDPKITVGMNGRKMKVFRHNVNKFLKNNIDYVYSSGTWKDAIYIYEEWTKNHDLIYNDYILDLKEFPMKVLYIDGIPSAFNIWEVGLKYIHYIANHSLSMPYINEFSRWLFYRDIIGLNMLVNDGGDLGSESIRRYKKKLNPVEIRQRWSWNL